MSTISILVGIFRGFHKKMIFEDEVIKDIDKLNSNAEKNLVINSQNIVHSIFIKRIFYRIAKIIIFYPDI
jgi:hypothetical protein